MRVAIFGGSFNPPHLAHQMAALYVLETAAIDELWIVPAFQHPFGKVLAPFAHRLEMCELAAAALGPRVKVSAVGRVALAEGGWNQAYTWLNTPVSPPPCFTWRTTMV